MAIDTPVHTPGSGNSIEGAVPPGADGAAENAAFHGPVDIHPALKDVQAMKEFKPKEPGWLDELMKQPLVKDLTDKMQDALENALRALHDLLTSIQPPAVKHMPDHLVNLFTGIVGFLVGLLTLYAFYLLLTYLIRIQKQRTAPLNRTLGQSFDNALLINTRYHQEQARAHAAKGQYPMAIRQLYYSALCLLDETEILPFEKTRTNFEYSQALANLAGVTMQRGFRKLSGTFEASRYGAQPVSEQDYETCRAQLEQLSETSATLKREQKAAPDA